MLHIMITTAGSENTMTDFPFCFQFWKELREKVAHSFSASIGFYLKIRFSYFASLSNSIEGKCLAF